MPVESAPSVAAWLCTQPHVACLALQASPERGGSKEQRVAYERAGLASAQIMYKRCAYSAHYAHHCVPYTVRAHPGLTARHVIHRRAVGRLGDQMSSPDDYLPVRVGPAFGIAPCGELWAKEFGSRTQMLPSHLRSALIFFSTSLAPCAAASAAGAASTATGAASSSASALASPPSGFFFLPRLRDLPFAAPGSTVSAPKTVPAGVVSMKRWTKCLLPTITYLYV